MSCEIWFISNYKRYPQKMDMNGLYTETHLWDIQLKSSNPLMLHCSGHYTDMGG